MKVQVDSFKVVARWLAAIHTALRSAVTVMFALAALAFVCIPVRASSLNTAVWLYAPGGAYYAAGYSVGGGHVSDPVGDIVGVVDGQGNVYDSDGNLIGYVVVSS